MKAFLALLAGIGCAASASAAPTLGAGYGEHMVLQRGQPIAVAGKAVPGAQVDGMLGGTRASATAAADGTFRIAFPAREASEAPEAVTVEAFSAACFYMGKKLRADRQGNPVGLIHSNWGGSAARAWLTPDSARALHGEAKRAPRMPTSVSVTATAPTWATRRTSHRGGTATSTATPRCWR